MSTWRKVVVILCLPAIILAWWFGYVLMVIWMSFRSGMLDADDDSMKRYKDRLTKCDLRALVQNVIDQQRQGFDVLASAAWDRVVEYMEATDAKTDT